MREKGKDTQVNVEYLRIARRDKKTFLNEQCKEIVGNNKIGKTGGLFKKIGTIKGTFHASIKGKIKDRTCKDLTEAEEIKRWQEYTEELYKNGDPHNIMIW